MKTVSAAELYALSVGLESLAKQIAEFVSRIKDDPARSTLVAEALALERDLVNFRGHLSQYHKPA